MTYNVRQPELRFLLECEVAAALGRSISHVKRLRISRKLTYLPHRPALIMQRWLDDYLARIAAENAAAARKQVEIDEAHQRRKMWAKHQRVAAIRRRDGFIDNSPWVPRKPKR
jgi:hypothetical protein